MSYLHINNLCRDPTILLFRECYTLEKVHGTSAHVAWKNGAVRLFSGGMKARLFNPIFNLAQLQERFVALGHEEVIVYGEAYGGSMQGMKHTYGLEARFIAFDVKVGPTWLDVKNAADVVAKLGLEFVPYSVTSTELSSLDALRDAPSDVAYRGGIVEPKPREGIVLRPLFECYKSNGERVIAKYKAAWATETRTVRGVDPTKKLVLENANAVALEWTTSMRLAHVLDKLNLVEPTCRTDTGVVVRAMLEDIKREGKGEIVWSKEVERAVGTMTAKLFHAQLKGG